MRNVQTSVPFHEVIALAYTCSHINPKGVTNVVLPGTTGFEGTRSVVYLLSDKDVIFADVKTDGILGKKHIPPSPSANQT
jgi:hypothetical protein